MRVKVRYCQAQYDQTVDFIAKNNVHFLGQHDTIRAALNSEIANLACSDTTNLNSWSSTMGFFVLSDRSFEGIDEDEDTAYFEFYVDLNVCNPHKVDTNIIIDDGKIRNKNEG